MVAERNNSDEHDKKDKRGTLMTIQVAVVHDGKICLRIASGMIMLIANLDKQVM